MLTTRLWTAAVALPAVVAAVMFLPAAPFSLMVGGFGLWGLGEAGSMTGARGLSGLAILALAGGGPLVILLVSGADSAWVAPLAVGLMMLSLVSSVAVRGADGGPSGNKLILVGALYVGVLFPYLAILRNRCGVAAMIFMMAVVMATDTAAYFGGTRFGHLKLMVRVSPQKTVEGAAVGLIAALAAGLLAGAFLVPELQIWSMAALAVAIGAVSELGDLAGSALKRLSGVKDSGWIFPGHGGLLDRTSSLVFGAVIAYYWLR